VLLEPGRTEGEGEGGKEEKPAGEIGYNRRSFLASLPHASLAKQGENNESIMGFGFVVLPLLCRSLTQKERSKLSRQALLHPRHRIAFVLLLYKTPSSV